MTTFRPDPRLAEAKLIPIQEVANRLGISGLRRGSGEMVGPCPACGGHEKRGADRFAINPAKGVFNCRKCGGSGDGIKLVEHVLGCDFKAALAWLVGETDVQVDEAEMARRRARAEEEERKRQVAQNKYRKRAIADARAIWARAKPGALGVVRAYLSARGITPAMLPDVPRALRFIADHPYVKSIDGRLETVHRGPAMIAGILCPAGELTAVHQTWVSRVPPHGKASIEWRGGNLAAKMVRGSKKGGAIRLITPGSPDTLVMGEGIETTLTAAVAWAALLPSAAFWAGVDLGNMAGRMQRTPGTRHSGLPDMQDTEAFVPPPWVKRLIFVQDGDSDPKATRAKLESGLKRAMARFPGLRASIVHAGVGVDLNDVLVGKMLPEEEYMGERE